MPDLVLLVTMMIGKLRLLCFLISAQAVMPSIDGMLMSSSTRSGMNAGQTSIASGPDAATDTSNPALRRSNMEALSDFAILGLFGWFTFFGACLAFLLTGFRLLEYRKKRVALKITLGQLEFFSVNCNPRFALNSTRVQIQADIRNVGLEPTTVVGVRFRCPIKELDRHSMTIVDFPNGVRIDGHDRKRVKLVLLVRDCFLDEKIRNLDAIGSIIDDVAAAGGDLTRINGISFTVDDLKPFQSQLRELAVRVTGGGRLLPCKPLRARYLVGLAAREPHNRWELFHRNARLYM